MSGPYDQQVLNQGAGRGVGVVAGQFGGQAGQIGAQAGQLGAQTGQLAAQAGQLAAQAAQFGGQATQFSTQTVTHQASSTTRRVARNGSSSSSSSSDGGLRGGVVGGAVGGVQGNSASYQQYSAESQYAQGGFGTGLAAGNESFGSVVSGQRRQGRYQKQVIRLPDQQGQVRQVRRRLPTPEPDTLERV